VLLIIASLPILKLKTLGTTLVEKMFSPVGEAVSWGASKDMISNIVGVFFSESSRVFLTYFVIGMILLIAGMVFSFMSFGFKIFEKVDKIEKENETEELKEKVKQLEKKVNEKQTKKKR
jgi:flagellar biosynthesis component FlhA